MNTIVKNQDIEDFIKKVFSLYKTTMFVSDAECRKIAEILRKNEQIFSIDITMNNIHIIQRGCFKGKKCKIIEWQPLDFSFEPIINDNLIVQLIEDKYKNQVTISISDLMIEKPNIKTAYYLI